MLAAELESAQLSGTQDIPKQRLRFGLAFTNFAGVVFSVHEVEYRSRGGWFEAVVSGSCPPRA